MNRENVLKNAVLYVAVGSRSRGLENQDSDWDYRGIYAFNPRDDWSFSNSVPENATVPLDEDGKVIDEQWFELRRFLHLMAKSSDFLEFLFTERKDIVSINRFGKMLRSAAHKFTNKNHARRLIDAGGHASYDNVEEYIKTKDYHLLGSKNLLYRAGRYMSEGNETAARKELCDVVRRLYLAKFMLTNSVRSYEVFPETEKSKFPIAHEMPNDWSVALALFKQKHHNFDMNGLNWFEDNDALFYVKHPDNEVTEFLRNIRYGNSSWDSILRIRNVIYHDAMQALENSELRENSESIWLDLFLNYYFEMRKND